MNTLTIKGLPTGDGVDIDIQTDPNDPAGAFFVKWLYDLIHEAEAKLEESQ